MPDQDGYPTERELEAIALVPLDDFEGMIDIVEKLWRGNQWERDRGSGLWRLSTYGWSGNETIISEMQANTFWWLRYWYMSRRGGYYEFIDGSKGR